MKKGGLVVYIVMIVVGLLGLYFYTSSQPSKAPSQQQAEVKPKQTISVAVANHDLEPKTLLKADDFQIKSIQVDADSTDVKFNLTGRNLNEWILRNPVQAGSWIPPSILVEPGTNEYIAMSLKPGNILYKIVLKKSDDYLLDNLKAGQGVDIYVSYHLRQPDNTRIRAMDGEIDLENKLYNRLKPLMGNKRVLAIRSGKKVVKDDKGVEVAQGGSEIIIELQDNEVKILKGIGNDDANLVLFPAVLSADGKSNIKLSAEESTWPVSGDAIFNKFTGSVIAIDELRG